MDLTTITVAQFKARFNRDFTYANQDTPGAAVGDQDIQNAFLDAQNSLNQSLFPGSNNNAQIINGYLYLTAHYLCLNLRAANAGLSGIGAFPVAGRTVGSVSESYQIPDAYKNVPWLAQYTQTTYGNIYLQLVLPYLVGNVVTVWGGALPGV